MSENVTPGPWIIRPSHDGSGDVGITAKHLPNVLAECFADIRRSKEGSPEANTNAEFICTMANACFSIAEQACSTPEAVAREIVEAFALLKDAPVLLIDVRAATMKNDEVALDYARLLLDWAPKAKALLARLSQKEAS